MGGENWSNGIFAAGVREWDRTSSNGNKQRRAFRVTEFYPLTDEVIRDHLLGKQTIGIYPLLQDDTCWFIAVDFDKKTWTADACAYLKTCREIGVPAALERSRSGNGGHVWIFFSNPVQASLARKLASAVLTRTLKTRYAMGLESYDRLFPSQDRLPKGGYGNLIALPLQHGPRENNNSVFVDDQLRVYDDQWAFLSSIKKLTVDDAQALLRTMFPSGDVINIKHSAVDFDEASEPWILSPSRHVTAKVILEPLPQTVSIKLGNLIYVEKDGLPNAFLDQLFRLAAFQNPEFYSAQAMRLSTFGKPRIISCADDLPHHVALPRGFLDEIKDLFRRYAVEVNVTDHRFEGTPVEFEFHGDLRPDQSQAVKALTAFDDGVLCAPTAFGKTAIAARVIAKRKVNTLVLVHRRQLMDQWRERLAQFMRLKPDEIGQIGGGKSTRTGRVDVAVMQSLIRKGEVKDLVAEYGQVIVDECHHVSAFSFEQILRRVKAKYVVGLTATPVRNDGHHPIILMQCGPIRFNVSSRRQAEASGMRYEVVPRLTAFKVPPDQTELWTTISALPLTVKTTGWPVLFIWRMSFAVSRSNVLRL